MATALVGPVVQPAGIAAAASAPASPVPLRRTCASTQASTYTVAAGDSWFTISRAASVGMSRLVAANRATLSSPLYPGDVVCLPPGAASAPASSGSAGTSSAAGNIVSPTCVPAGAPTYTVGSGDSWSRIAERLSVTMSALLTANRATTSSALHPGNDLCVPPGADQDALAAHQASVPRKLPANAGGLQALPVQGPCWFGDTWRDARANGRRHEGLDMLAATGQYVYAVADGTLTKRAWDQPGLLAGNAWWLTAPNGTYWFYGHLSAFAPGLTVGSRVQAGQIIGFVGETGSAAAPHLHFEIHPGGGGPVDPYPIVKSLGGCKKGRGYLQPGGWYPGVDDFPDA